MENVVARWRKLLEGLGLPDVAGRGNIDRIGTYLLSYGVLSENDRLNLPLKGEDDDPRVKPIL